MRNFTRSAGRGRGPRGRIPSQRSEQFNSPTPLQVACWGCGGPHYQRDCPELRSGTVQREGKAPMRSGGSRHQISAAVNNHQVEHQSTVVESSGTVNNVKLRILFDLGVTDSFILHMH